ncbi:MAG TPA: hypothetical protein VFH25_09295 [Nitrososphaeraceae archaeon]|nr:hypothetical protein [Nitrososphaeraceae archaeon]
MNLDTRESGSFNLVLAITLTSLLLVMVAAIGILYVKVPNALAQQQGFNLSSIQQIPSDLLPKSMIGIASMADGVQVKAVNITGAKEITMQLNFTGNGSSPEIVAEISGLRFNFEDLSNMLKTMMPFSPSMLGNDTMQSTTNMGDHFKMTNGLFGNSTLPSGWMSPTTVTIQLAGNSTLDSVNIIGVAIHRAGHK